MFQEALIELFDLTSPVKRNNFLFLHSETVLGYAGWYQLCQSFHAKRKNGG